MNTTLQELRAYIKASGFESPAANAKISAYIETNILNHPNSLFKHRVPPLDIIIYAIRTLLTAPDAPHPRDIPDLLDFATTIEFFRNLALQKVDEALTFHAYYKDHDQDRLLLTDEEVARLSEYQSKTNSDSLRKMYIGMVMQYCMMDIYYLWTSDPPRTADVTLRLSEYFPMLNKYYRNTGVASPRLFLSDLSVEEREHVRDCGIDCCQFVADSCQWANMHRQPGQTLANVFQTPAFADAHPCTVRISTLRTTTEYYMDAVEKMVKELQDMFQPNES
ncbi:hypothetical protein C8F04DRAFT_1164867 [Mycena alexandri]|uniref:Uncharacterized protein n=1 Tax=Mycena alexandri TaxID=1745969 RepID=A0AAD6WK18_9AGAR|nr:hypothetical protein C8F04DRAFT_1164867 [Mycena alexandri]